MIEGVLNDFPTDEVGRLKVILTSWVEHNEQNSEKFKKWREKVKNTEDDPIYNSIFQAAQEMKKVNEKLSQLSIELQEGR